MKLFVGLCFLAFVAAALADCGCLKCNPNLQIVSPKYSPCKVIYRNNNQNCPSRAPYTLQQALPPPPPVFIPKEYDYQLQVFPLAQRAQPCSTYEYGLQAAVLPPPVFLPLTNLRTATERVVMDSPACRICGSGSTCNNGFYAAPAPAPAPLPAPLPIRYQVQADCGCRGPIIEPLCPSLCPRYARNHFDYFDGTFCPKMYNCKKCRGKRSLIGGGGGNFRKKRDLLELPMKFVFDFIPKLVRGPVIHALHTIQHNANPAVIRARVNANKHRMQAHLAKTKHKQKIVGNTFKNKATSVRTTIDQRPKISSLPLNHKITKVSQRIHKKGTEEELKPKLSTKLDMNKNTHSKNEFTGRTNKLFKEVFGTPNSPKQFQSRETTKDKTATVNSVSKLRKSHVVNQNRQNPQDARDLFLAKLQNFNEIHERGRRSTTQLTEHFPNKYQTKLSRDSLLKKLDKFNEIQSRNKRSILLGSGEFSLPFFEIDDDAINDAYNHVDDSSEQVGARFSSQNKRKNKRRRDDSEMESGEEILGNRNHPLHEHPFVVLLKTPLKLIHHLHDMRKNFQPILYSFPKLLHTSKNYLKDFGKNLQTNVLDFASNIMGDFGNGLPKRHDSLFFPSRGKRSVVENTVNEKHEREKRYILKVVDEEEVQEFLKEKLGGYFDGGDEHSKEDASQSKEEDSEIVSEPKTKTTPDDKKYVVKKLSPKVILDNNGKPFIEINGHKRPLFHGKHKENTPVVGKTHHNTHEKTSNHSKDKENNTEDEDINEKIDEVITKAKRKLKNGETIEPTDSDEMPTQTVKEKIIQISTDIQNLINLDFGKYSDLYDDLYKLDSLKKTTTEYWKKVMISEKTNEIHCKIKLLNYFREIQGEKDKITKKIGELMKISDNFIVKKLIKLLVRLQKLQCLIQKVVDHFDNRMRIGTMSDTEKEIKFVDYLSSLYFASGRSKAELECSLKKEKDEALRRQIKLLENLRVLLKKDDIYTINEVAKKIWVMKNIEKLQQEAVEEMNVKLADNMKVRKELKILFDLLKQIEDAEQGCEKLLVKIDNANIVGSRNIFRNGKRINEKLTLADILQKNRITRRKNLSKWNENLRSLKLSDL